MNILEKSNTIKTSVGIELVLTGDQFDLDVVTEILGIKPTIQWNKGDGISNRPIVRKDTTWSYSIGLQNSFDIEEQSKQFLSVFKDKLDQLKLLKRELYTDCLILYTVKVFNLETPIMSLSSDMINFASAINARIDFDLYFC